MVEIKPFRGLRYNPDRVDDISKVIAPPWDVIDDSMELQLRSISPFNVVNLISKNCNPENVKETFEMWLKDGILIEEREESFYFMKHRFKWMGKEFTRKGLFTILRLEDFKTGNVIPHERIFEKYSTNRYRLIEKCRTNFSPVLMLYQDASFTVEKIIEGMPALSTGQIRNGEAFEFGRITDNKNIKIIKEVISQGNLIIADGHHRYNAALKYYKDNPASENSFILVFLVNINSPDVLILPTHRYITSDISFLNRMDLFKKYFSVREVHNLNTMSGILIEGEENTFGIYERGRFYIIVLKDINPVKEKLSDRFSNRWKTLNTVILHEFILPYIFNTQPDEVIYHQTPEYLLEEYKKRNTGVIFFLNAVSKKQFLDICLSGELMPQKTTYFYPKVPSGLVIYKFGR